MKTVIIHGQNHEGSTCMTARELAQKVGWETEEFFSPAILTSAASAAIPASIPN